MRFDLVPSPHRPIAPSPCLLLPSPRRRVAASPRRFFLLPCSLLRGGTEFFVELFDERKLAGGFFVAPQPAQCEAQLVMRVRTIRRKLDGSLQHLNGFAELLGLHECAAQRPV